MNQVLVFKDTCIEDKLYGEEFKPYTMRLLKFANENFRTKFLTISHLSVWLRMTKP